MSGLRAWFGIVRREQPPLHSWRLRLPDGVILDIYDAAEETIRAAIGGAVVLNVTGPTGARRIVNGRQILYAELHDG